MITFYDAVTPGNIPAGAHACLYWDGLYKATAEEAARFAAVRWITVEGGAAAAAHAGAADAEQGNPVFDPALLREWAVARKAMNARARVYTDRGDLPRNWDAVSDLGNVVWWISTLSLDNGRQWTAAELLADVLAVEQIALEPSSLWAVQYAGGMNAPVDTNILFGDF
jgi:hypothetical protein